MNGWGIEHTMSDRGMNGIGGPEYTTCHHGMNGIGGFGHPMSPIMVHIMKWRGGFVTDGTCELKAEKPIASAVEVIRKRPRGL